MRKAISFLLCLGILVELFCCITQPVSVSTPEEERTDETTEKRTEKRKIDEIKFKDFILKLNFVLVTGKNKSEKFKSPYGIAVDEEGNVYVAETRNHRVQVFSSSGEYIRTFGHEGEQPGEFSVPIDLIFDDENNLYIAEFENKRIQILSKEGKSLNSFKILFSPDQIAIDKKYIYITERYAGRAKYLVHKYSKKGNFIMGFRKAKKGNLISNNIHNSINLCSDSKGNLYIAYKFLPKVEKYSPEGKLLMEFEYPISIKNRKPPIVHKIVSRKSTQEGAVRRGIGKLYPICYDIAIDSTEIIYLLIASDHEKDESCTLYLFDPLANLLEKVELPIICGKICIDSFNNLYFTSPILTKVVFKYSQTKKE